MTSTLLVANAEAPSVQSSITLNETFNPLLAKMESCAVLRPPLATRPPTQPTHTFTRTRISGLSLEEETGSGLDASLAAPSPRLLVRGAESLLAGIHRMKSTILY